MSHPFDATLKDLVQSFPLDWLAVLGLPIDRPVTPLNVDLSTVSAAADTLLGVGDPVDQIIHLEFQSSRDAALARRVLAYNCLVHHRFAVPVHSAVVLLRRAADDGSIDGTISYAPFGERGYLTFRFELVRIWEWKAEDLLNGSTGVLPLAMLGEVAPDRPMEQALSPIVHGLEERLVRDVARPVAEQLLTAAYVLAGLRLTDEQSTKLFRGLTMLEESTTLQGLLRRGALQQGRKTLLRLGKLKFGTPSAAIATQIEALGNLDELDRLSERLMFVQSWDELLAAP